MGEQDGRPTLRLRAESDTDASPEDFVGVITNHKIRRALEIQAEQQAVIKEQQEALREKGKKSEMFSLMTLVITVCGFLGGLGATITWFSQAGIWNPKSGFGFESKEDAKAEHQAIRQEFKEAITPIDTKLDLLLQRSAPKRR